MTEDKNNPESTGSNPWRGDNHRRWQWARDQHSGPFSWAHAPGFHPLKALTVIGGFLVFPPLGVLALGYFLWNAKGRGYGNGAMGWAGGRGCGRSMRRYTGNAAFDEHQMKAVESLREERRAFHEFRANARRQREQEAYDAFRKAQAEKPAQGPGDDTPQA